MDGIPFFGGNYHTQWLDKFQNPVSPPVGSFFANPTGEVFVRVEMPFDILFSDGVLRLKGEQYWLKLEVHLAPPQPGLEPFDFQNPT